MTCPRHIEASAYIDNMLGAAEGREFSLHLQGCALCRQRVEALTALHGSLRAMPSPTPGIDIGTLLARRLVASREPARRKRPFWIRWGAPGLAVAASAVAGIWIGGLLGAGTVAATPVFMTRAFDPVPPGGLCVAAELCRASGGMQ